MPFNFCKITLFNSIPVIAFIMKFYIEGQALGAVQTQLVTKGVTSLINAVLAVVVSVLLAKAVRPALRKAGILSE